MTFVVTVQSGIAAAQVVVNTAGGLSVPFCHVPCRSTSSPDYEEATTSCIVEFAAPPDDFDQAYAGVVAMCMRALAAEPS